MKKLIAVIFILLCVGVAVKCGTDKSVGTHLTDKIEDKIAENKQASAGDTIVCPICHKEFVKKFLGSPFDSEECEEKYEKLKDAIVKEDEIAESFSNTAKDIKNSVKKNFYK